MPTREQNPSLKSPRKIPEKSRRIPEKLELNTEKSQRLCKFSFGFTIQM